MKKSIRIMLVVGVCTSMLFGCQSAPVAQNENGVSFAKDSTQNSEVDEKTLGITQLDNVYHCKYTVKAKNREFNIDSDIQGYDKKSICVAEVESDVKNLSIDNINKAFMDGKGEVSISDNQSDLSVKDSFDNGESSSHNHTVANGSAEIKSENLSIEIIGSDFGFTNETLYKKYGNQWDNGATEGGFDGVPVADKIGEYSIDQAQKDVIDKLSSAFGEGGVIKDVTSAAKADGDGYYEFNFYPCYQNSPIVSKLFTYDSGIESNIDVKICKDGIFYMNAEECLWKTLKKEEKSIISFGEAVSSVERYMKKGLIVPDKGFTYNKCGLGYLAKTKDWKTVTLTPVWYFMTDQNSVSDSTDMQSLMSMGVYINALTGEIE